MLFTLIYLLAKYFRVLPQDVEKTKFGAAADKLLGSEVPSCGQENAIGSERERRLRNSGKKDKKKRKTEEEKKGGGNEEDDTFDKV